ncbi:MAG: DUF6804 family protein [Vicinamibacterales bacterium]
MSSCAVATKAEALSRTQWKSRQAIALVPSAAVVVGFADLPYGYHTLLRFMICGFSLFLRFGDTPLGIVWHRWVTGATAVLYNPIVPARIGEKNIWIVLNLLTVAWFWFVATQPSTKNQRSAR